MSEWIPMAREMPPQDVAVSTRIDDGEGARNEQPLVFHNRMFWHTDMSMYVYYKPTHWRPLEPAVAARLEKEKQAREAAAEAYRKAMQ